MNILRDGSRDSAAGLLALAGCQKATDGAAFEKNGEGKRPQVHPGFQHRDVETILAKYAPDAEVLAPANPRAVGHEAIRALVDGK